MIKRLVSVGLVLLSLGSRRELNADRVQKSGCRDLKEQVTYDIGKVPVHAQQTRIVNIEKADGRVSLTIWRGGDFYVSTDGGNDWSLARTPQWDFVKQSPGMFFAASDSQVAYRYKNIGLIEVSKDGGNTWKEIEPTINGTRAKDIAFQFSGDHSYIPEFEITAINPLLPLTIYATVEFGPHRGAAANFNRRYYLPGTYVSDDGGESWRPFTKDIGMFDERGKQGVLGINPASPNLMFGQGKEGVVRSTDGGKNWEPIGESRLLNLEPLDEAERARGIVPKRRESLHVKQFIFDASSTSMVYMLSRNGVHRSADGGDNWVLLNLGFDRLNAINSFVVDPLRSNRVFAGTDRGLFVSEDRGCTFTEIPVLQH